MSIAAISFGSDTQTTAAPEVLAAIAAANHGPADSYGADAETTRLAARMNELFGREVQVLMVATGTAANALALAALCPPLGAVYCHPYAHVHTDECGAPEFYTGGAKLLPLACGADRLELPLLEAAVAHAAEMGVHHVQPAAISISQATEWGTVYAPGELAKLCARAHALGLAVHMDGARFANAVAHLGCTPAEASWKCGVDILSFGASKNGALAAEAIVCFNDLYLPGLERRRKRGGHLWAKQRFLSAQFNAMLEGDLWLRHAHHANALAGRLGAGLEAHGIRLQHPVQANEVFAALGPGRSALLRQRGFGFYDWPAPEGGAPLARLVTRYDMDGADVDALLAAL
jgi:threonine aldolase